MFLKSRKYFSKNFRAFAVHPNIFWSRLPQMAVVFLKTSHLVVELLLLISIKNSLHQITSFQ